jgi:hypothetical protein
VAVQDLETVQALTQVCASVGACQTGTEPALAGGTLRLVGVGLGLPEPCAVTGTRMETCRDGVLKVVFSGCVEPGAAGTTNERDGTAVLTVADAGFCDDLVIGPLAAVALELRQYRHVERDPQSVEVARLEADWLETLTPTRPGCRLATNALQLADGSHEVNGTLHFACGAGSQALSCPRGSTDLTLRTRGLQMLRESGGAPCELRLQMTGTVSIDDGDRSLDGRACRMQLTQTFSDFLFVETPLGDGTTIVRQAGRITVDQLGPLDLATRAQGGSSGPPAATPAGPAGFRFVDGMDCPAGGDGELEVRQPLGEAPGTADLATVRFQQSGTGDPQAVFAFTAGDVETITGCIGISPLTACE